MSTYNEVPVNITSAQRNSTGTLYTCPGSRYARATLSGFVSGTGQLHITRGGLTVIVPCSAGAEILSESVYLKDGDSVAFNIVSGTGVASITAIEFAIP